MGVSNLSILLCLAITASCVADESIALSDEQADTANYQCIQTEQFTPMTSVLASESQYLGLSPRDSIEALVDLYQGHSRICQLEFFDSRRNRIVNRSVECDMAKLDELVGETKEVLSFNTDVESLVGDFDFDTHLVSFQIAESGWLGSDALVSEHNHSTTVSEEDDSRILQTVVRIEKNTDAGERFVAAYEVTDFSYDDYSVNGIACTDVIQEVTDYHDYLDENGQLSPHGDKVLDTKREVRVVDVVGICKGQIDRASCSPKEQN